MAFEKFKNKIKDMNLNQLNKEIQERKKLLNAYNAPRFRQNIIDKDTRRTRSQFHFKKTRKELAILNTVVHQRLNKN